MMERLNECRTCSKIETRNESERAISEGREKEEALHHLLVLSLSLEQTALLFLSNLMSHPVLF